MVTQLYSQALGSLFVAFYDSQGLGGDIQTRFQTAAAAKTKSKSRYDRRSAGQSVLV
jgi:hypothetical protein